MKKSAPTTCRVFPSCFIAVKAINHEVPLKAMTLNDIIIYVIIFLLAFMVARLVLRMMRGY
jgi:hypothetical protein